MAKNIMARVERDLLDEKPVDTLLRKLILLGTNAGSAELRDWAAAELRGYQVGDELPSYRTIPSLLQIDGQAPGAMVKHQTISSLDLPDFTHDHLTEQVPLRMGVNEIQSMIDSHQHDRMVQLVPPGAPGVVSYMNREGSFQGHITALYWAVSTIALKGVLDQIRTRLAELIAELRSATPTGAQVPSAEQTTNAVHFVINGRGNRVSIAQASGGSMITPSEEGSQRFWTKAKVGSAIVGLATIVGTAFAIWQVVSPPR